MSRERNLSWLDFSTNAELSLDGTMLLFDEESSYAGSTYAICLRKLPDAPVVRLGEGSPQGLSRDGKWALALVYATPQRLVAYPTGAGEAKNVDPNGLESYAAARWLPDGKAILICGWMKGSRGRCYVRPLGAGQSKPVTPEGIHKNPIVSPDGRSVAVRDDSGRGLIYALEGGEPLEVKGLTLDDEWIRWSTDGRGILVRRGNQAPVDVDRIDVASGRREKVLTIDPSNRNSLLSVSSVTIAGDEKHYAYDVWRARTKLFTLEGVR
jgi:hypothetical protein